MTSKQALHYLFWKWIEPIGSTLIVGSIIIKFIVALYVIPTGSMQPTLHGSGDYGIGDKVLVNKFVYDYESPKRWDVIVFNHPFKTIECAHCGLTLIDNFDPTIPEKSPPELNCQQSQCSNIPPRFEFVEKEYIKRCVGLPGDEVSIQDGNVTLWDHQKQKWKLPQKSIEAQQALWVKAWDSQNFDGSLGHCWTAASSTLLNQKQNQLSLKATSGPLIFKNDLSLSGHGDQAKPSPLNAPPCGDIALDLELLKLPKRGFLSLNISRNLISHRAELDFQNNTINILVDDKWIGKALYPSDEKKAHQMRFARVDGSLQLSFNGRYWSWDIPHFNANQITHSISPQISLRGTSLQLARLQVLRDIYYDSGNYPYLSGTRKSLKLNSREYFAMGDNPIWSKDSRMWGPVREEKLIGKALMVLFPLNRTKFIH